MTSPFQVLPRSLTWVRDSWWLLGDVRALAERVDAHLITLSPGSRAAVRSRFPAGTERLVSALMRGIEALAELPEPEAAANQVSRLGAVLVAAGMPYTDMPEVGYALVRAVRESYQGEWSTALGSAWTSVQGWLVAALETGARAAAGLPALSAAAEPDATAALTRIVISADGTQQLTTLELPVAPPGAGSSRSRVSAARVSGAHVRVSAAATPMAAVRAVAAWAAGLPGGGASPVTGPVSAPMTSAALTVPSMR